MQTGSTIKYERVKNFSSNNRNPPTKNNLPKKGTLVLLFRELKHLFLIRIYLRILSYLRCKKTNPITIYTTKTESSMFTNTTNITKNQRRISKH